MDPREGARKAAGCLAATRSGAAAAGVGEADEEAAAGGSAAAGVDQHEGKPDLVTLFRVKQQIKQHLMEYNTTVNASEESIPDQGIDEKVIESSIEDLEREMEEVKISYQNKTLALQRIQITDALRTKLKDGDDDSKLISDTMQHVMKLSTAILKSQQQSRELEEKLNEVKQSRLALKRAEECKLSQLQDIKRKRKAKLISMEVGEMFKKIHRNLEKEIQMTTLIQNIFQNLIIGSRVNWAKDPALKAVVLQLEKNVTGM